ncbi:MAG: DUF4351 domain-containing protein [Halanaerobiales bacterium]|nr:DUF4351 domain-containing protein [Halanaerobiales bacterium]
MQQFDVTAHNYDFVFKDSFNLFKNDIADFLEVEMPGIVSYLETEFTEVETNTERMDLNFTLQDGSILHLEEEIEVSVADLIRFASYDLKLYNRYRDKIRTIILCIKGYPASKAAFNAGSLAYNTTVVNMSDKDGKEKMEELWRDRKMVKFFKYVEEQGKKKGKEEGKIEGKQEEARLILMRQIKAKFGDEVENEIINLINEAELSKIEDLSEKIVTTNSESELVDFLKH